MEEDRQAHSRQHRVLQRYHHRQEEGDGEHCFLYRAGTPHRRHVSRLDGPDAYQYQQPSEGRHRNLPDHTAEADHDNRHHNARHDQGPPGPGPRFLVESGGRHRPADWHAL
ncbi:unannotated protein [freshwater metagenome]|uniref:Unannotated protein n=1 Tax=freshwater metagenome TaxID=449393 RepID=A0A6J7UVI9_9ZZZZ